MKKKKGGGGGANWMDTYGDMVTLLLCFFVLLYSMSTISEEKWRAIVTSFNPAASKEPTSVVGNDGPNADMEDDGGDPSAVPTLDPKDQEEIDIDITELFEALQAYAESAGMQQSISVTKDGGVIYVSFRDTAFFDGDSSVLRQDAYPVLNAVAEMLSEHAWAIDSVHVEGHTAQAGTTPNRTRTDRMLSNNRAAEVVIYIQDHTDNSILNPGKLVSVGYGQWHPVADNGTADGKAQNRRVEFIISGRNLEEELENMIESYDTQSYTTTPTD